jgi:hypothetical protein
LHRAGIVPVGRKFYEKVRKQILLLLNPSNFPFFWPELRFSLDAIRKRIDTKRKKEASSQRLLVPGAHER